LAGISFAWIALRGAVDVGRLPAKKKVTTEKRDFQDSATKVKVTSLLQIRVFWPGSTSLQHIFGVSPRVCVCVCHFRK